MLPKGVARRLSIAGAVIFTVLLFLTPILGQEVNGARRWIGFGFAQFQPSEFLKPLFIVSLAWLLSLRDKDKGLPVVPLTGLLTGIVALLLMQQRSEEHTSELQSLMRISYAVFCLKKKINI